MAFAKVPFTRERPSGLFREVLLEGLEIARQSDHPIPAKTHTGQPVDRK
jgi:hypothetical protein